MPHTLLSALLSLAGMACLAALMTQKKTDRPASIQSGFAVVCVLLSFLLLPSGPFPAYVPASTPLKAPMALWFVLFGLGCAGAAIPRPAGNSRSPAWAVLSAPPFLGLVYAVCTHMAAGFPGRLGHMETFVTLPLGTGFGTGGISPVQLLGIGLLALATLLYGACFTQILRDRTAPPFLSACLRLAVAVFTVCLFFSALLVPPLPNHLLFIVGYVLHFGLLGLVVALHTVLAPHPRLTRLAPPLLGLGALLCLQ